jgi:hypothetical protein
LDESRLLDVRGNHDTFDVPFRGDGGRGDLFAATAASGRRNATARAARSPLLGGSGGGATGAAGAAAAAAAPNPRVAVITVDAAKAAGLRRPANFAGTVDASLRAELAAALRNGGGAGAASDADAADVTLAFGHFPLSFLEDARLEAHEEAAAAAAGSATVGAALARAGTAAYLCGHLHWRFGARLHRWHAFAAPASRPQSASRLPLLELEAGDWKESRAWRLIAFDAAAANALSFRDAVFDATSAGPLIVMITSPPDARYAQPPPAAAAATSAAGKGTEKRAQVKALVFPPKGVTPSDLKVTAVALCGGAEMASVAMTPGAAGGAPGVGPVWRGPAITGRFAGSPLPLESFAKRCAHPDGLRVAVRVTSERFRAARGGDERPVEFQAAGGSEGAAPAPALPAPMGTTALETFLLAVDGPRFVRALFWTAFGAHGALFVLGARAAAASAARARAQGPAAATATMRRRWRLLRALGAPLRGGRAAAAALGSRPRLWAAHAAYLLYLSLGPWFAADLYSSGTHSAGTDSNPAARGAFYATGISAGGAYVPSMDAVFITGPHCVFVLSGWAAAVTLLLAAADAAPPARDCSGGGGLRRGLAALGRAAAAAPAGAAAAGAGVCALAAGTAALAYEVREAYGSVALTASPGVGWLPPLALAALAAGLAAAPLPRCAAKLAAKT